MSSFRDFRFLIVRPRHIFRLMTATFIHCRISTLDFNASLLDSRECQFLLSDLFLLHPGINPQPNVLDYTLLFSERHDFFFRSGYRPSHFLCIIASFFYPPRLPIFRFELSYPPPRHSWLTLFTAIWDYSFSSSGIYTTALTTQGCAPLLRHPGLNSPHAFAPSSHYNGLEIPSFSDHFGLRVLFKRVLDRYS